MAAFSPKLRRSGGHDRLITSYFDNRSFSVAACARPMMAGDKIRPAAIALDDCKNTRRLTGTVFMMIPPGRVFLAPPLLRPHNLSWSQIYDQTEVSRKGAAAPADEDQHRARRSALFRSRHRRPVPALAGGILALLPAALDHDR